jgi:hypothetical protein
MTADLVGLADHAVLLTKVRDASKANGGVRSIDFGKESGDAFIAALSAAIDALQLRALAGAEVGGWRSMEDAPRDGSFILICCGAGIYAAFYKDGRWWLTADDAIHQCHRVTHWQPLPPPPGSGRGGVNNSTNDEER